MSLFLDLIVIFAFCFSIYTGVTKGFIKSIMGIVVVLAAIIGAVLFSPPIANRLNENVIGPAISGKVEEAINSVMSGVDSIDLSKLFEEQPEAFTEILDKFNIDFDSLNIYYSEKAEGSPDAEGDVSSYIAAPVSMTISKGVAFAILFVLISAVLSIVSMLINMLANLPILRKINKTLGFVLGFIKGLLYAWGLSVMFCNLLPHLAVIYEGQIPASVIDSTVIIKMLGQFSIASLL